MSEKMIATGLAAAALAAGTAHEVSHGTDPVTKAAESAGHLITGAANSSVVKTAERAVNTEQRYSIPSPDKPYREVTVGTAISYDGVPLKDQLMGDTGAAWAARNYDSISDIAEYTGAVNSTIAPSAIMDLLQRENVEYQREHGIPEDKIDPSKVVKGQTFRLPELADHVGVKIVPEKQGTMPNGMKVTIKQHQARY